VGRPHENVKSGDRKTGPKQAKEITMAVKHKIDVNTASKDDLMQIPGISEKTADAVIEFRDSRGTIDNIDDLAEAEQINSRDLDSLREWLTTGPEGEEEMSEERWREEEEEW
jgi:DNA uptake protein ComE-like DNA-binding protein